MEYVLKTNNICKNYKKNQVLKNVNMTITKGDIYGFVGENGSGKTTIIRLITGLIHPTSGSFELFGVSNTDINIKEARKKIGAVVETPSIYKNMSAYENLKMQAEIIGGIDEKEILETLKTVGLDYLINENKSADDYSLGMRQRLGIAMCLLGNVEFIILDEPMNGLDPEGIIEVRELILKLNKEKNITFLISSHILTELSLVASKYGIISKGNLIKEITAEEFVKANRKNLTLVVDNTIKLLELLAKEFDSKDVEIKNDIITIYGDFNINSLLTKILENNINIVNIKTNESNIEDYYISLIRGAHHD